MRYYFLVIMFFAVSHSGFTFGQVKDEQIDSSDFENNLIESLGGWHSQWYLSEFYRIDNIPNIDSVDIIKVNSDGLMLDGFSHSIYIDQNKLVIYIQRTGGIAGVNENYGSIKIGKNGKLALVKK